MESLQATEILAALAHEGRLAVFRLLSRRAPDAVPAGEIATALGLKRNTLSVHVAALERVGLVRARRAGRSILYSAEPARMGALVDYLVADCCRGRPDLCAPRAARALALRKEPAMDRPYNVLFICTANSARSILAEAILNAEGKGRFVACSAGTHPSREPHRRALDLLKRNGHAVDGLRSKSVLEFQGKDAPRLDFVFTVCDRAANEDCPPWPGQPMTGHWGLPDPAKAEGTEAEKALAFARVYGAMLRRIQGFISLPVEQLDRLTLQNRIDDIGRMETEQPVA